MARILVVCYTNPPDDSKRIKSILSLLRVKHTYCTYPLFFLFFFFLFLEGIRRRRGRGCVHTCQLRGRVWLNTHTFTHHTYKPRTKHLHSLCWYHTNGLTDKWTDLSWVFFVFFPSSPCFGVFYWRLSESKGYTGVRPRNLEFFHLTHGDGCCSL